MQQERTTRRPGALPRPLAQHVQRDLTALLLANQLARLVQQGRTTRQPEAPPRLLALLAHQELSVHLVVPHVPLPAQLEGTQLLDHPPVWPAQLERTTRQPGAPPRLLALLAHQEMSVYLVVPHVQLPAQLEVTSRQANQLARLAQLERTTRRPEAPPRPLALLAQLEPTAMLVNLLARLAQLERTTRRPEAPPRPLALLAQLEATQLLDHPPV